MDFLNQKFENGVLTLTLNRPEKRNALNTELLEELNRVLDEVTNNEEIRALVITGKGKAFCAGGDVESMISRLGKAYMTKERLEKMLHSLVIKLQNLKIPTLAKVNGSCFGAGLVLATGCDIIIASDNAKFGFVYGNIGLISEASYHLVRYMGLQRAKHLVFGREVISASEAREYGLVLQTAPLNELDALAEKIISGWVTGPRATIGLSKQLLNAAMDNHLEEQLRLESAYQGVAFTTDEHKEGVDAFLEKRSPKFP